MKLPTAGRLAASCLVVGLVGPFGCNPPGSSSSPPGDSHVSDVPSHSTTSQHENGAPDELLARGRELRRGRQLDAALVTLEQAEVLYRQRENRVEEGEAILEQSQVLADSGAIERAAERVRRAIAVFQAALYPAGEGRARIRLSGALSTRGDYVGSRRELQHAEAIFREHDDRYGLALIAVQHSVRHARTGSFPEAIRLAEDAISVLEENNDETSLIRALFSLAYSLQESGNEDRALATYERLIELAWRHNDQGTLQNIYCNRAEIRRGDGDVEAAERDLRRALDGFESARARSPSTPDERAVEHERQFLAYDRLIQLLADTSRHHEGFTIAERFKARAFLEQLAAPELDRAARGSPELRQRERRLLNQLGDARLALEAKAGASRESERRIDRLGGQLDALRAEQRMRDPLYAEIVAPRATPLDNVREQLAPGDALLAYWISDQRLLLWTATADTISSITVPLSRQELEAVINAYLEPLRSSGRAIDAALRGDEDAHIRLGQRLFEWLIAPTPAAVREATRLIVIPDGPLHYLPFEALIEACEEDPPLREALHAPYAACRYLGQRSSIVYGPSVGVLFALAERGRQRDDTSLASLLAMAPEGYGPGHSSDAAITSSTEEVQRLATLFPRAHAYLGADASEQRFKEASSHYRFLHLATHGIIRDRLPMSSGVLLAPDDNNDGLLQAYEVLGLDLHAELVILSSCRSGRGRLSGGEGILGLSRSFLHAGADAVLVSQWDVDDQATARLMEAFYRHHLSGLSRDQALLQARRDLSSSEGRLRLAFRERPLSYAHPRFWSAFILVGSP